MMMQIFLLLISFVAGLTVGLQINYITSAILKALQSVQDAQKSERKKNTGVVRPGLNDGIQREIKSSVIRPRVPVADPNNTNSVLESVRSRTSSDA